jgi:hypothetical protein
MERLDKGHLHPELEVLRLTCLGWESNPNSSKELFKQSFNSYSEHRRFFFNFKPPGYMSLNSSRQA